ncbi:MAG: HAMP domain-containing sensor histidine kinase [Balneolaceae bacterium]
MKRSISTRNIFLGIGLIAVVTLTGMNVYSLFELHETTIEAAEENKRNQIDEFANQLRYRFASPFFGLRRFDMKTVENHYLKKGTFPEKFHRQLTDAFNDPLFSDVYWSPHDLDHCMDSTLPIYRYDSENAEFKAVESVSDIVCEGIGLARSRSRALSSEYVHSYRTSFDTHRSLTVSLINLRENRVVGHITLLIDRDYLVNQIIQSQLQETFGNAEQSGVVLWLRDWMAGEVLAVSDTTYAYTGHSDQHQVRQRYTDLPDNWILNAQLLDSPAIAASDTSLFRNLIVLGTAVIALFGALIFMYITAKRERELAQRQAGFLANVTHELKTPLAAMQAAGENISDGRVADGERLKSYGTHIYNETIRLRKMIDKLLDVARIDSGQSIIQKSPQHLDQLVESWFRNHYNYVTSRGFKFHLNTEDRLPTTMVDVDHIETILSNLVDNAIKYSGIKKEIAIEVARNGKWMELRVTDRGVGISHTAQKRIFDKFYRIEDSMTARTKGHGLGLSIVRDLVHLHEGDVVVESSPGSGTTFTARIPVVSTAAPAESPAMSKPESIALPAKKKQPQAEPG